MKSDNKKDLLVAYSVKRKNRKKYADGGKVKDKPLVVKDDSSGDIINVPKKPGVMDYVKEAFQDSGTRANIDAARKRTGMAEGGEIEHEGDELLEDGQVDLDDNAREIPNQFYHANEHEALEENFDEDIMKMSQPEDSNLQDVEISSDKHDRIAQMRSKMRSKRGLR